MVNDWESAFEACPPYGEGKGAYGPEDTALLTEMERTLEKLLPWLEAEGVYLLNEYLEVYRRYARRSSRYYFYRGSLYGAREALEIWAAAHLRNGRGYDIVLARDRPEPLPADGFEVAPPR